MTQGVRRVLFGGGSTAAGSPIRRRPAAQNRVAGHRMGRSRATPFAGRDWRAPHVTKAWFEMVSTMPRPSGYDWAITLKAAKLANDPVPLAVASGALDVQLVVTPAVTHVERMKPKKTPVERRIDLPPWQRSREIDSGVPDRGLQTELPPHGKHDTIDRPGIATRRSRGARP